MAAHRTDYCEQRQLLHPVAEYQRSISLWSVDANLNYVNSQVHGPYEGWTTESLSVNTSGASRFRVLWRDTDGRVSVWIVDPSLNLISSRVYGPYVGFDPTSGAAARKSA